MVIPTTHALFHALAPGGASRRGVKRVKYGRTLARTLRGGLWRPHTTNVLLRRIDGRPVELKKKA